MAENQEINRIFEKFPMHRIFDSLTTKESVRCSSVCKDWKRFFDYYPCVEFNQLHIPRRRGLSSVQSRFVQYVDGYGRMGLLQYLNRLRFLAHNVDREVVRCCQRSVSLAKAKNVINLEVRLSGNKLNLLYMAIPDSVRELVLSIPSLIGFIPTKNLVRLHLEKAFFLDDRVFSVIETNCRLLEHLSLINCPKLLHLRISCLPNFKKIDVALCANLTVFEVSSPLLESVYFRARLFQNVEILPRGWGNVRTLSLNFMEMNDLALQHVIAACCSLENLILEDSSMDILTIHSLSLRSIDLIHCHAEEVNIDAQQLFSFHYDSYMKPVRFHLTTSSLSRVKIAFNLPSTKSQLRSRLQDILGYFERFSGLKVIAYNQQVMKIYDQVEKADLFGLNPWYEWYPDHIQYESCKVQMGRSSRDLVKSVDDWLTEFQGDKIVLMGSDDELLQMVITMAVEREKRPSCCKHLKKKCWRHHIGYVQVSTLERKNTTYFDFQWKTRL